MTDLEVQELARRAESLYDQRWKSELERTQQDMFVAIEPNSEEYFLGKTLSEAAAGARQAHPGCLTHIVRVGHPTAVHIGNAFHER